LKKSAAKKASTIADKKGLRTRYDKKATKAIRI